MKKTFILLTGVWFAMTAMLNAQNTLTVNHTTPDGMAAEITAALGGAETTTIATLVIAGDAFVTFEDCRAIRMAFPTADLKTLDLSQAKFQNDSLPGTPPGVSIGAFNPLADGNGLAVTEVKLPTNLRVVGDRIFRKFKFLTNIVLPSSVIRIGQASFNACEQLKYIKFPDGLKTIDSYAFYQCYRLGLDALNPMDELPEGLVGDLGNLCFSQTSVNFEYIPVGITRIGSSAFKYNGSPSTVVRSLASLIIYQNIAEIGATAFQGQMYLNNIEINRMTPPTTGANAFDGIGEGSLQAVDLYIPIGTEEAYNIEPWNLMVRQALLPPITGLSRVENADIRVYPNPTVDKINVSLKIEDVKSAKILNLTGSVVRNLPVVNNLSFDVSDLAKGVYFIQLNNDIFIKFAKN